MFENEYYYSKQLNAVSDAEDPFCEYDKIEPEVKRALEGNPEVCFKGAELKEFCMEWQFVSILSEYMAWSMLFSALGED